MRGWIGIVVASVAVASVGLAQGDGMSKSAPGVSAADYARAEQFLGYNTGPLVLHADVQPAWLARDRFWYHTSTARGPEYVLVDPSGKSRTTAFDPTRLATALRAAGSAAVDPAHLSVTTLDVSGENVTVSLVVGGVHWQCEVHAYTCTRGDETAGPSADGRVAGRPPESRSPDGKRAVFIRDYNLWVRDVASGQERQLTHDGVVDFGYATDNAGWTHSDRPIVLWSPDSRKVATYQQDQRGVGEMYLVETTTGHPRLRAWKYPLPGDSIVTTIQRVIIDVDSGTVIRLRTPPDQHRSTLCDDIACRGGTTLTDAEWSADGSHLAFVSTSRDHKHETLRVADASTGDVRDVLEESVPTYYESGIGEIDWRYLPASNEVIWYSERDNWGQLYLYDLQTGRLKNQITTGDGDVTQILRVDEAKRQVYFLAVGREKGRDPYFAHLYRVGFDGSHTTLLTPEDANHNVSMSPSGHYFVDTYSRPDVPPVTVVRDENGKLVLSLEIADISKLLATGWRPPIPFTVKARDGETDLYGLMFRPTRFDSTHSYPIVNHIYPGPQTGSVGTRSFVSARGDAQSLAELGFVVIELDGMGTPMRSKKFHDAYYADMGDNTLPDQVAGMRQLAQRYRWIDTTRAGIYGHSGGGYATADAMFRYPDFFKVGVSEAGNHDNRVYEDDWGEKWQGLLVRKDDSTNYDNQANELIAKNLKGHLLLAHGLLDDNVPPYNTLLVEHALMQANKDFDLILFTDRNHGFGNDPYMIRRRWDYFVRYLLGAEPPAGYELHPPAPTPPVT
jgi:dipeptidyl-peptidase 4